MTVSAAVAAFLNLTDNKMDRLSQKPTYKILKKVGSVRSDVVSNFRYTKMRSGSLMLATALLILPGRCT